MAYKKGYFDSDNRQLTDVFRELQETRLQYETQNSKKSARVHKATASQKPRVSYKNFSHKKTISMSILLIVLICAMAIALFWSTSISAKDDSIELYSPLADANKESISIEINRHRLNAHNIITSNASLEILKEQVIEEQEIPFESLQTERSTLPKGEEVILQEGVNGKKNVTFVRSYQNGELTEETILNEEKIQDYVPQIVDVGTSEFLAKAKAHLNDTLYLTKSSSLYEGIDTTSKELAKIEQYFDVILLELPNEEWCKVSYEGMEGYLHTSDLTSAVASPTMPERNRIQKVLIKLNMDMPLNQSTGLTLADYKKILTGLPNDKNDVFKNNYEVFYNIDKKYNINGIFLASMAIHESAWGSSQIANDKKNLFGYGAYDATPYSSSYDFDTYAEGIELVAKVLVKYYINPAGTKIYDNEKALATYYNGPTVSDVNIRYASDTEWHTKVYSYMEMLYNRLKI